MKMREEQESPRALSRRRGTWAALAAVGAVAGVAGAADAAVIYTPVNTTLDSSGAAGVKTLTLNFPSGTGTTVDGKPFATFTANTTSGVTIAKPNVSNGTSVEINTDTSGGLIASAFAANSTISPASPYTNETTNAATAITVISATGATGNFTVGAGQQYIGFWWNGLPQYQTGWISFQTLSTTATGSTVSARITGFAIETTPLAPFLAGSTVSVPEPTSLSLLALGAAGLAGYRRRAAFA